jgi:hypothetical protein
MTHHEIEGIPMAQQKIEEVPMAQQKIEARMAHQEIEGIPVAHQEIETSVETLQMAEILAAEDPQTPRAARLETPAAVAPRIPAAAVPEIPDSRPDIRAAVQTVAVVDMAGDRISLLFFPSPSPGPCRVGTAVPNPLGAVCFRRHPSN